MTGVAALNTNMMLPSLAERKRDGEGHAPQDGARTGDRHVEERGQEADRAAGFVGVFEDRAEEGFDAYALRAIASIVFMVTRDLVAGGRLVVGYLFAVKMLAGSAIVVSAGLFTLYRERRVEQRRAAG